MAQRREVVLAEVDAVEEDAPFGRIVQSRDELGDRRFARAVLADERDALARARSRSSRGAPPSARCPDTGIRRPRTRSPRGSASAPRRAPGVDVNRRLHVEEREQIFQVEALLVDPARRHEQTLDQVAALRETTRRETSACRGVIAPATARTRIDDIRAVVAERADERERRADESPSGSQSARFSS